MTRNHTEYYLIEQTMIDNDLINTLLKQKTKLREARDILFPRLMSVEIGA